MGLCVTREKSSLGMRPHSRHHVNFVQSSAAPAVALPAAAAPESNRWSPPIQFPDGSPSLLENTSAMHASSPSFTPLLSPPPSLPLFLSLSFSLMVRFQVCGKNGETVAELEGELLRKKRVFSYFMLVALEAGGPLRALLLLVTSPVIYLLDLIGLAGAAIRVMIFISTVGMRPSDLTAVARATLPKHFFSDLSEMAFEAFSGHGGNKFVATFMPRLMAEYFLREHLGADGVLGPELLVAGGRFTGLVAALPPSLIVPRRVSDALLPSKELCSAAPPNRRPKPVIFHDGRLVAPPTELNSFAILLWLPMSVPIAIARMLVGLLLPYNFHFIACAALGLRLRATFSPTAPPVGPTLFACNHRTLLDPVIAATLLRRRLSAVTYSLSVISEALSPISTVRLSRERKQDEETMKKLLRGGDLVVCPEGTTCREPFLLRFSPLFAEVAEEIVPVAVAAGGGMFYGSTVRGYKSLDSFFFLMNPTPEYRLRFLERVAGGEGAGEEVAGRVAAAIAAELGFERTGLTRRDKYRVIAGSDGRVEAGK
ncbi:glycerol-3-phosphate acyltransferase RAM2-like [Wolffia australiana]